MTYAIIIMNSFDPGFGQMYKTILIYFARPLTYIERLPTIAVPTQD